MTTETLYRFRCDAPNCPTSIITEDLSDTPNGWRTLKSTNHIPVPKTPTYSGRRRSNTLSYSERCRGAFTLHLCSQHHDAFNAHLPRTEGLYTRPGKDGKADVSCSCGALLGLAGTGWRIAAADMSGPSAHTERVWWRHLPPELRWYAEREKTTA